MGQTLVFLLLVTEQITVPVGFAFYVPDPVARGLASAGPGAQEEARPEMPAAIAATAQRGVSHQASAGLTALGPISTGSSAHHHQGGAGRCGSYGTAQFVDAASATFGGVQVMSQLRRNQRVRFRNRTLSVQQYFERYPGVSQAIRIRGGREVCARVGSARLYVRAHDKKRFVIALKYAGEEDYRYLLASDLTWRTPDIVQAFTWRWLVEVFVRGTGRPRKAGVPRPKQPGEEGSSRSLVLSLRVDHCLLLHPAQLAKAQSPTARVYRGQPHPAHPGG